jgi:hypothetical protein
MIAMQPGSPDLLRRAVPGRSAAAAGRESERSGILPPGTPVTVTAQFQPLDPGILNQAIPAFFIGRNQQGFWIARDASGQIGGIFLLESSALSFAKRNSRPTGCATIFPFERFELDLENKGNRFAVQLGSLIHSAMRLRRRLATFIGRMRQARRPAAKDS